MLDRLNRNLMKKLIASSLLLLASLPATAQTQPEPLTPSVTDTGLTDEQTAKLLEQITRIQKEFAKTKKEVVANALAVFQKGAASDADAQELFIACWRVINIDRKPALTREEQEERDKGTWRDKALAELGGNAAGATVARLQVRLLAVTLQSASKPEADALVASLREVMLAAAAYVQSLAAAANDPGAMRKTAGKKGRDDAAQRIEAEKAKRKGGLARGLRQPVFSTLFAQAYSLGNYLEEPAQWPKTVVDFRTAYEDVILPFYRDFKKTSLAEAWDEYLRAEMIATQATLDAEGLVDWTEKTYKQLYWKKWLDLLKHGISAPTATEELVKVIRDNPTNPNLKTWIANLAEIGAQFGGLKFGEAELEAAKPAP